MRLLIAILLVSLPLQARTRAVRFPVHERILWIAPHPDDEALIAPLLGKKCVDERASCTLLVLTRGEAGECKLPGGCGDLGALRAAEMIAAGAALHAYVIQWSLPDVLNPEAVWPARLADDIAGVIALERPDVIYTFDPNHGSSCHPAHRFAAQLVVRTSQSVRVIFVETAILRGSGISFASATASATAFDARGTWHWLVSNLEAHRSQFTPQEVEAIRNLPVDQRRVWLLDSTATPQHQFRCD